MFPTKRPFLVTTLPVDLESYTREPLDFQNIGSDIFRIEVLNIVRTIAGHPYRVEFRVSNICSDIDIAFDVVTSDGQTLRICHPVSRDGGSRLETIETNSLRYFIANELELPYMDRNAPAHPVIETGPLRFLRSRSYPKPDEDRPLLRRWL